MGGGGGEGIATDVLCIVYDMYAMYVSPELGGRLMSSCPPPLLQ